MDTPQIILCTYTHTHARWISVSPCLFLSTCFRTIVFFLISIQIAHSLSISPFISLSLSLSHTDVSFSPFLSHSSHSIPFILPFPSLPSSLLQFPSSIPLLHPPPTLTPLPPASTLLPPSTFYISRIRVPTFPLLLHTVCIISFPCLPNISLLLSHFPI